MNKTEFSIFTVALWVMMPCYPVGGYQHFRLLSF